MTFTHMDGLKSLDTPGKFGHTWKHWPLEPWKLLWMLPDNSYGFFQTTLMDSSRQLLWILPDNSYGFFQIPWISMNHDITVTLAALLRGPCHFGPSCAEKTMALKLMLLVWIVDTMMEYAFDEAIRNPMDNGLANQSPPPPQVSPLTIPLEYLCPMVWCQARWRLQLLRRWLLCKSCIFGSFLCFRELWFYSFVVLYWFGHIQLHLKILHSTKCISIHYEYLKSFTKM